MSKSTRLSLYSWLRRFNDAEVDLRLIFIPSFTLIPRLRIAITLISARYREDAKSKRRIDRWEEKEREREGERQVEAATTTAGFNFNPRRGGRREGGAEGGGEGEAQAFARSCASLPRCCCCTAMRQSYVGRESGWCSLCLSPSLSISVLFSSSHSLKPVFGKALGICVRDRVAGSLRVFTSPSGQYASTLVHVHARVTRVYDTYVCVRGCMCECSLSLVDRPRARFVASVASPPRLRDTRPRSAVSLGICQTLDPSVS